MSWQYETDFAYFYYYYFTPFIGRLLHAGRRPV